MDNPHTVNAQVVNISVARVAVDSSVRTAMVGESLPFPNYDDVGTRMIFFSPLLVRLNVTAIAEIELTPLLV